MPVLVLALLLLLHFLVACADSYMPCMQPRTRVQVPHMKQAPLHGGVGDAANPSSRTRSSGAPSNSVGTLPSYIPATRAYALPCRLLVPPALPVAACSLVSHLSAGGVVVVVCRAPRGAMRMREESRGYAGVPLRLDDSGRVSFDDVEAGASTNVLPPTSAVLDYYKPPPLAIEVVSPLPARLCCDPWHCTHLALSLRCACCRSLVLQDLAPQVFSRIRAMFGVQSARFKHSLTHVVKQTFSEGASGAFMCFTGDNRYIIKTMSAVCTDPPWMPNCRHPRGLAVTCGGVCLVVVCPQTEAETLRRILPDYVAHLEKYPESLLAKFFSCTKLTLYTQTLYFVVMENVFRRCTGDLHERYDLKGSWVNRTGRFNSEKTQYRCRYCHEQFHVHDKEECSKRPNQVHVANTLLLDEDLLYKVRGVWGVVLWCVGGYSD